MSTPERYVNVDGETLYDPWKGAPPPTWSSGLGFNEDTAYAGPLYSVFRSFGAGAAAGEQLMAGGWHFGAEVMADIGEAVHAPGAGPLRRIERTTADFEREADQRVKDLTPDPTTSGGAVQTIHSLGSAAYRMGVGAIAGPAGGAALLGSTEAVSRYQQLRDKGVDDLTARRGALIDGMTSAAGALMPAAYGTSLLSRLATGAAANTGFGMVNRYADHQVLEEGGYHEMADQQAALDGTQLLTDGLLGAAFGGLHHVMAGKPGAAPARDVPGVEDAALTTNLALRARAAAPGVAADPGAAAAHDAALRQATTQLLSEQPVDVAGTGVENANFVGRHIPDQAEPRQMLLDAIRESGALSEERHLAVLEEALGKRVRGERLTPAEDLGEIPRAKDLSTQDQGIEQHFVESLQADYEGAKARYAALPDSQGGKVLNVDTARELSPDYLEDRTKSAAVHEPASWFIKRLYEEKLAEAPAPGQEPVVLFTGGGTGAGKSTAVKSALGPVGAQAQIVFDTNMNRFDSARQKVDQALRAGKRVQIAYVYREPVEALTHGALTRAMRQEREFGTGRTVPLEQHIGTHAGSSEAIRDLVQHYANDPRVQIHLIDNSRGRGKARATTVEELPRVDYNLARGQAEQALQSELAAGRISPAVYRGFAGREPEPQPAAAAVSGAAPPGERGQPGEPGTVGAGAHGEPQPERAGEHRDELTGPTQRVSTAAGRTIEVRPKVVEASDLVTSDRPEYPQELQPRQRGTRVALEQQVNDIAQHLEPERLGASAEADRGAPIVGPDNVVESGNGRVLALRQVNTQTFSQADNGVRDVIKRAEGRGMNLEASVLGDMAHVGGNLRGAGIYVERIDRNDAKPGSGVKAIRELTAIADKAGMPMAVLAEDTGSGKLVQLYEGMGFEAVDGERDGHILMERTPQGEAQGNAARYRAWLESQGFDTSKFKEPVLVRQRVTPMTPEERRAFTVEANQAATAALSPVERAQADSRLMNGAVLSQLRPGEISAGNNAGFVRAFMERIPQSERNAMVNPDGTVSQEGVRRLQSAILAKAYGGTPESNAVLGRMLESTDNDMRSTMGALLDAAPAFARLREAIAEGKVDAHYDVASALAAAVETVSAARLGGRAIGEHLAQGDLLGHRPAIVDALARALYDRKGERLAGRDKVAQSLTNYADRALKQRLDQGMLFGDAPATPEQLIAAGEPKEEQGVMRPAADMFGLRTPQGFTEATPEERAAHTAQVRKPLGQRMQEEAAARVAQGVLQRSPNIEIVGSDGAPERGRAELLSADDQLATGTERAPGALESVADCASQRAA